MSRMKLSLKYTRDAGRCARTLLDVKWSIRFPFTGTAKTGLMVAIVLISLAVKLLPIDL